MERPQTCWHILLRNALCNTGLRWIHTDSSYFSSKKSKTSTMFPVSHHTTDHSYSTFTKLHQRKKTKKTLCILQPFINHCWLANQWKWEILAAEAHIVQLHPVAAGEISSTVSCHCHTHTHTQVWWQNSDSASLISPLLKEESSLRRCDHMLTLWQVDCADVPANTVCLSPWKQRKLHTRYKNESGWIEASHTQICGYQSGTSYSHAQDFPTVHHKHYLSDGWDNKLKYSQICSKGTFHFCVNIYNLNLFSVFNT